MSKRKRQELHEDADSQRDLKRSKPQNDNQADIDRETKLTDTVAPNLPVNGQQSNSRSEKATARKARREAKSERKGKRRAERENLEAQEREDGGDEKGKANGVGKPKRRSKGERDQVENSAWKLSDAVGGQMLDLDPLFSKDEEYMTY